MIKGVGIWKPHSNIAVACCWAGHPLVVEICVIAAGSFRHKDPPEIDGSGYVVRSLEVALWSFCSRSDFCEDCPWRPNAETAAAVYGQIAGAFYREPGISQPWLDMLAMREKIVSFADKLRALSKKHTIKSDLPESAAGMEVLRAANEAIPVPFDRSYWVIPGKFLAGAYPGDPVPEAADLKLQAFLEAGIRCFIDLTSPEDRNLYAQLLVPYQDRVAKIAADHFKVAYRRMPITDLDVPSNALMKEILDTIDGTICGSLPLYVHCLGGIGRTGTVVGCWLVRHGIAQGQAAIDLIRKLRRNETHAYMDSPETRRQRRFICEWIQGE